MKSGVQLLRGACHCGAVRFEVEADLARGANGCNCSICTKLGSLGGIVAPEAFRLLSDEAELGAYRWGAKISTRYFCRHCGTHCFARGHLAELGGDYVSFSYRAIDELELGELRVAHWDGRHDNWAAGPSGEPWAILRTSAADAGAA